MGSLMAVEAMNRKMKTFSDESKCFDRDKVGVMHTSIVSSMAVDFREQDYDPERLWNRKKCIVDDEVEVGSVGESLDSETTNGCENERKSKWVPVNTDMLQGAEPCFDAIVEYAMISSSKKRPPNSLRENVKRHLSYMGWKIEFMNRDVPRFRYTSPEGQIYMSLSQICQHLGEPFVGIDPLISLDGKGSLLSSHEDLSFPFLEKSQMSSHSELMAPWDNNIHGEYWPQVSRREWIGPQVSKREENVHCDDYRIDHKVNTRVDIDREYCPQALLTYYFHRSDKKEHCSLDNGIKSSHLKAKAKKHLSFMGWTFWFASKKGGKREMRYGSPNGKCYYSLRTACKGCIDEGGTSKGLTCSPVEIMNVSKEAEGQELFSVMIDKGSHRTLVQQSVPSEKWPVKSYQISQFEVQNKRRDRLQHIESNLIQHQSQASGKYGFGLAGSKRLRHPRDESVGFKNLKKQKGSKVSVKLNDPDGDHTPHITRPRKQARHVLIPRSSNRPRTILSSLIDNNLVPPSAKLYYRRRKDHHPMAEGWITRDGIKCSCCYEVFSLSRFEAHAGSSYRRAAANIFLEDGRSLLECQMQMTRDISGKSITSESCARKDSNGHHHENDNICSVCRYGGDLVLCDQCPSSFHLSCLSLKELPEGDWFCPSCCCGICGENKFGESEQDNTFFSCHQCEHHYHVGCLREWGYDKLESYHNGAWFCCKECEKIFFGLQKMLGKPFPVGVDNLTWTLLKPMRNEGCGDDAPDIELTEVYSKLNIALDVMHECFEPVKEPNTGRDLVEDVIYCRRSDLNRLNFQGFYTVVLERNDELISVATIRVFGEKVAEIPLVATRFQYRRLGMCHILMDELEKKLMELGVGRLTLPAASSVLKTWTSSFGFSKMTDFERRRFLDFNFLDFQDTVMCQKLLLKIPSSNQSTGAWMKHNIEFDRNSSVSEVLQEEQVEEADSVYQGPSGVTVGNNNDDSSALAYLLTQQTDLQYNPCVGRNSLDCLLKDDNLEDRGNGGNDLFKCYMRRRIPTYGS